MHNKKGIVIAIVKQESDLGNTLDKKIFDHPFVIGNGGFGLYYLSPEITEELEHFVRTCCIATCADSSLLHT